MVQKVRLVFYVGARAAGDVVYDHLFDNMAAACAAFADIKYVVGPANVAFVGQDFEAAHAAMKEGIAA
jgi:hypothetical protein